MNWKSTSFDIENGIYLIKFAYGEELDNVLKFRLIFFFKCLSSSLVFLSVSFAKAIRGEESIPYSYSINLFLSDLELHYF